MNTHILQKANIKLSGFYFVSYTLFLVLNSCMSSGTHGTIKSYQYSATKDDLSQAVQKVISENLAIHRDTTKAYDDNTKSDYYNDGENYITVFIKKGQDLNKYTFKYGGNKNSWDTSKTSSIFIAYAFDKNGNGGSEGNGGFPWYKFELKKRLIKVFENELIYKIDSILIKKHTAISQ